MVGFTEFDQYDAMGLAELLRKGQVTPAELCEEAIEKIERVNPQLNAIVTRMYDQCRKEASKPLSEGPFTGVPLLIKDLHYEYAGVRVTSGCKALRDYIPDHDCEPELFAPFFGLP